MATNTKNMIPLDEILKNHGYYNDEFDDYGQPIKRRENIKEAIKEWLTQFEKHYRKESKKRSILAKEYLCRLWTIQDLLKET